MEVEGITEIVRVKMYYDEAEALAAAGSPSDP